MLTPDTPVTLFKTIPNFPYVLPAGEGSGTDCGARLYALTEAVPKGFEWFWFDSATREMSVEPASRATLGINAFTLKVVFAKFPGLKNAVTVPFKVEIIYNCAEVVFSLADGPIPLIFHQVGETVINKGI